MNVILEMLSNVNLGKDLTILALGGRVAVIGSRGPVEINPRDRDDAATTIPGHNAGEHATPVEFASIYAALGAGLEKWFIAPGRRPGIAIGRNGAALIRR